MKQYQNNPDEWEIDFCENQAKRIMKELKNK